MSVARRYNQFLWLREILIKQYPGVFVPPVPKKVTFKNMQDERIEERRVDMERFLRRLQVRIIMSF